MMTGMKGRWRSGLEIAALLVGGYFSLATSPAPVCYFGAAPYDGQTDVPTDTVITFRYGEALPPDLPALDHGAVGLVRLPDEAPVDVAIETDLEAGIVTLTPLEPLEPDQAYKAWGVSLSRLNSSHYLSSTYIDGAAVASAEVTFYTRPSPKALAVTHDFTVIFSEAINLETVSAETVRFFSPDTETGEVVEHPWTSVALYEGHRHILTFSPGTKVDAASPLTVHLEPGVRGMSDMALDGDGDFTGGEDEDAQELVSDPYTYGAAVIEEALGETNCHE